MKYKKGMKIKTLEDCELPHDMRAEIFTIIDTCVDGYEGFVKVKLDKSDLLRFIDKAYIDENATIGL